MSEAEVVAPPAPAEVKPEQQPMETESATAAAQPQQQQAGGDKQTAPQEQPTAKATPAGDGGNADLMQMSTRQYLDQTVVPILLQGLSALARERPRDPIDYLSKFLLDNKDKYTQKQNGANA